MDFKTEKKGYNRSEVDEYIMRLVKNYEQAAARREAVIEELEAKLEKSEEKNRAYRDKESLVSQAITSAVAKADEIDRLAQLKYTREMQQLKAFHDKWLSYYDKILKKYPLDSELINAGRFNEEMSRILEKARAKTEEAQPAETEKHGKETRIGYTVIDSGESAEERTQDEEAESEAFLSGDFDPVERIRSYLAKERPKKKEERKKAKANTAAADTGSEMSPPRDYADRSPSGFSFEEALHPEEDLADIMRDLGLID